jgi:CRP-like cAMP-binding protein
MDITPEEFCSKSKALCHNKEDAGILLSKLHKKTYNNGEIILKQGESSSTLYIIWDGSVSVSLQCNDITIELGEKFPGSWVGELGFIEPGPASATITANENTTLLSLDEEELQDLLKDHPDIVTRLLHALSLNLAVRLRETKQIAFKKIADDDFILTKNSESQESDKWYKNLGHKLMGISGEK